MAEGWDQSIFLEQQRSEDYICSVCTDVMRDCVETDCGHMFCDACVTSALKEKQECPDCREKVTLTTLSPIKSIRRKILSLRVKCTGSEDGCSWIGMLKDLHLHEQECKESVQEKNCRYLKYGCTFKGKGDAIKMHEADDCKEHLELVETACDRYCSENERLKEKNRLLSQQLIGEPVIQLEVSTRERKYRFLADALLKYCQDLIVSPYWTKLGNHDDCVHHSLLRAPIAGIGMSHEGKLKVPMMKSSGLVEHPIQDIVTIVESLDKKGALEPAFDNGHVVENFRRNTSLRYEAYKSMFPTYPRDFLLLHIKRKNLLCDNSVIVAQVSVQDTALPEKRNYVRGDHVSAWVITETDPRRACFVQYFEHTDLLGSLPTTISTMVAKSFCHAVSDLKKALKDNGRLLNRGKVSAFGYVIPTLG